MTGEIIKSIEVIPLKVKLIEPFIISLGKLEYADNVVVKITTQNGIIGFGECSPFRSIHGETAETCLAVGKIISENFIGKDALKIEELVSLMDKIIFGNTSIKSAFDISLYDIASQHSKVPLYEFLGGKNDKVIHTDYTVSIDTPEKMTSDAKKILNAGFPVIKVKLGGTAEQDIFRMKSIRAAVGNEIPIRIDANQGWSKEDAIYILSELKSLNIQHCEEPIARWKFMKLSKVKKQSPIPIMADECCGDEHDAEKLIELNACQYFNIKLGKSGGIYKGLKIVRLAEAAGIHLQVGAMLESRIAMTAFAHFALCSPLIEHYDFDTALMFKEDPVTGGIQYKANGVITITETPGLGATIEDVWLQKMEKVIIQ